MFSRYVALSAKIEVLFNYWKWFLYQLNLVNVKVRSKKMGEIITKIGKIPWEVVKEMLT